MNTNASNYCTIARFNFLHPSKTQFSHVHLQLCKISLALFCITVLVLNPCYGQGNLKKETGYFSRNHPKKTYVVFLKKKHALKIKTQSKTALNFIITKIDDTAQATHSYPGVNRKEYQFFYFESPAAGRYTLTISPDTIIKFKNTQFKIEQVNYLSPKQIKTRESEFTDWVATNAHSIQSIKPGKNFADLVALKTALKNVELAGLGESTHGTMEFYQMKSRLIAFLARDMGYRTFLMETNAITSRTINSYVQYGKGNLDTILARADMLTMKVREMKDLLLWIRNYNANVNVNKKINFIGIDMYSKVYPGWAELYQFCDKTQFATKADLSQLNTSFTSMMRLSVDTSAISIHKVQALSKSMSEKLDTLTKTMFTNKNNYTLLTGRKNFESNLQNLIILNQQVNIYKTGRYNSSKRDVYMAQNIIAELKKGGRNAKMVVWAHNYHTAITRTPDFTPMGYWIYKILGQKYYSLGLEFYSGNFLTLNMDKPGMKPTDTDWESMNGQTAPKGSLSWYFSQTRKENFFLDFSKIKKNQLTFLDHQIAIHDLGAGYSVKFPSFSFVYPNQFDGMIYIKQSTPTHILQ